MTYTRTGTTRSRCPGCQQGLVLLAPLELDVTAPAFFVCHPCARIFQVGHGEVSEIRDERTPA